MKIVRFADTCNCMFCLGSRLRDHTIFYMFYLKKSDPPKYDKCQNLNKWYKLLLDNNRCCCAKHFCDVNNHTVCFCKFCTIDFNCKCHFCVYNIGKYQEEEGTFASEGTT